MLSTPLGEITLEIDTRSAPVTAVNFLRHVEAGVYDRGRFQRTVRPDNHPSSPIRIEVVQAMARETRTFPPILLEQTSVTGLRDQNGTVSMACEKPDSISGGAATRTGRALRAWAEAPSDSSQAAPADAQRFSPAIPIVRARPITQEITAPSQGHPTTAASLSPAFNLRMRRFFPFTNTCNVSSLGAP